MDKMTIVGPNGKPKYILSEDNIITDLQEHCRCHHTLVLRMQQIKSEQEIICPTCGLPIVENS